MLPSTENGALKAPPPSVPGKKVSYKSPSSGKGPSQLTLPRMPQVCAVCFPFVHARHVLLACPSGFLVRTRRRGLGATPPPPPPRPAVPLGAHQRDQTGDRMAPLAPRR